MIDIHVGDGHTWQARMAPRTHDANFVTSTCVNCGMVRMEYPESVSWYIGAANYRADVLAGRMPCERVQAMRAVMPAL